ncbi:hypothetical protein ACU8KH_02170 [Lachancea thermotolerans]
MAQGQRRLKWRLFMFYTLEELPFAPTQISIPSRGSARTGPRSSRLFEALLPEGCCAKAKGKTKMQGAKVLRLINQVGFSGSFEESKSDDSYRNDPTVAGVSEKELWESNLESGTIAGSIKIS